MIKLALTATAAALALAGAAHAQTAPYVNLGGTYLPDPELGGLTGRAGVDIGQNFGLEAEGTIGVDGDEPVPGTEVELGHLIGGFARVRAPLSPSLEGFVRGGYYTAETTSTTAGVETEFDDDDFAAGGGVQWNFGERSGLRAEYTNYGLSDDGHAGQLSYVLKF